MTALAYIVACFVIGMMSGTIGANAKSPLLAWILGASGYAALTALYISSK